MRDGLTISLCMIVKNEEDVLDRCLTSIQNFVDEIVIVDTGSIDKTKEIAEGYGAKIYDFQWCEDFAKARNFAFSQGTKDYIFWLDADDYITEENLEKLMALKKNLSSEIDAVSFNYSLGRDHTGKTKFSIRRNRLVKREANFSWVGRIHEYLHVFGNIQHEDIYVHHGKVHSHTDRNLRIFRLMRELGETFSTRDRYYFANELYYNHFYEEAIDEYEEFIQSKQGWIEDRKNAALNLATCYQRTNGAEKVKIPLLQVLSEDIPRGDICCKLAEVFLSEKKFDQAIFWYKAALGCAPEDGYLGIDPKEYYTWIPAIQLCVCYSQLEQYKQAYYYNELAAVYGGQQQKIESNRQFLSTVMQEKDIDIPQLKRCYVNTQYKHL